MRPSLRSWRTRPSLTPNMCAASVATVYRLNARAFTAKFPFPQALGSPSDYVVTLEYTLPNKSRTTLSLASHGTARTFGKG